MNGRSLQVRDEHRRDVAVVREQVALRDPLLRPERLVQVRQLEDALAPADLLRDRRAARGAPRSPPCPRAGPGTPVPAAGRRASTRRSGSRRRAAARPRRRRPSAPSASSAPPRTATRRVRSGFSLSSSRSISASSKPVPTLPAQRSPPSSLTAEHERAEGARAPALPLRVADDDELLPALRLHLEPVAAAPSRLVAGVRALADDALEPLRRRRLEERVAVVERLGEPDGARCACRAAPPAARAARPAAGRRAARPRPRARRRDRARAAPTPAASPRSWRAPGRRARRPRRRGRSPASSTACATARATDSKRGGQRRCRCGSSARLRRPRSSRSRGSRPTSPRAASSSPAGTASASVASIGL